MAVQRLCGSRMPFQRRSGQNPQSTSVLQARTLETPLSERLPTEFRCPTGRLPHKPFKSIILGLGKTRRAPGFYRPGPWRLHCRSAYRPSCAVPPAGYRTNLQEYNISSGQNSQGASILQTRTLETSLSERLPTEFCCPTGRLPHKPFKSIILVLGKTHSPSQFYRPGP